MLITDDNIKEIVELWFENNDECINNYGSIDKWDTSRVTNMSYLFQNRNHFNFDISKWNTSNVKDMSYMFHSENYLIKILVIGIHQM